MIQIGDKKDVMRLEAQVQEQGCCDCDVVPVVHARMPEGTAEQVKLMAALSDPTRLQIVAMLAGQDEALCVCEIQPHFDLGQPTVSHHLKVLRDAHLVTWEKRGLWVYYSLDHAKLEQATAYLNNLLSLSKLAVG